MCAVCQGRQPSGLAEPNPSFHVALLRSIWHARHRSPTAALTSPGVGCFVMSPRRWCTHLHASRPRPSTLKQAREPTCCSDGGALQGTLLCRRVQERGTPSIHHGRGLLHCASEALSTVLGRQQRPVSPSASFEVDLGKIVSSRSSCRIQASRSS